LRSVLQRRNTTRLWNDPAIKPTVKLNSMTSEETDEVDEDPIDIWERNDILLFTQHCEQVIKETMESHYKNLDAQQHHRIKNTLDENLKKLIRQNMRSKLKEKFISHEVMLNNLSAQRESEREKATSQLFIEQSQSTTPIYYSLLPQARCPPPGSTSLTRHRHTDPSRLDFGTR
jgi:hypothetical protein